MGGEKQGGKRSHEDFVIQESIKYLIPILKHSLNCSSGLKLYQSQLFTTALSEMTLGGMDRVPALLWFTAWLCASPHLLQHFKTSHARLWTAAEVRADSAFSFTKGRMMMFYTKGAVNILKCCSKTWQSSSFRAWILARLLTPLVYICTSLLTEAVTPSIRWELNHCMSQEYCKAW